MKRLLLISALCLSAIGVVAQQNDTTTIYNPNEDADTTAYRHFIEEGKVWDCNSRNDKYEWIERYTFGGDTVIAGYACKKMMMQQLFSDGSSYSPQYLASVFEEERKVWMININTEKPILMYDFNLQKGSKFRVGEWWYSYSNPQSPEKDAIVTDIQDVRISNKLTKLYTLTIYNEPDIASGYNVYWLEGIGSVTCPMHNSKNLSLYGGSPWLKQCTVNGVVIFDTEDKSLVNNIINGKTIPAYRPLVERGKVWRTAYGPDVENAHNFYEYLFLGNVTVDGKECYLLGRSELAFNEGGVFYPIDTICVGALYEEGQKVYVAYAFGEERRYGYFNSNYFLESPVLLYDFASPVGTEIKLLQNGPKFSYIIADKSKGLSSYYQDMYNMTFNGNCTFVGRKLNENIIEDVPSTVWLEGVGSRFSPLDNIYDLFQYGYMAERLLTCSVGDEILYMKGDLNSIWPDNDVKKQWLDFTHTVKPRPKAPRRSESVEAGEEEESLTGEYSARELFVNLKTLDGAYTVTMRNSQSEEVYRKEVQTSNIVALNTDLTKYAKGTYTLVIENDAESYTATLTIGDEDGITSPMANAKESMVNVQWLMFNGIYDLTGRRLTSRPAKGLYIENQKLKVR